MVPKLYVCRIKPWTFYSCFDCAEDAQDWFKRQTQVSADKREVRVVRWDLTKEMKMKTAEANPSVIENNNIEEAKESNVVDLKLVGGSNPPVEGDWLSPKEIGSCFLAMPKNDRSNFNCGLFRVVGKFERTVVLASPSSPTNLYVIPRRFCIQFEEHENLGTMLTQEQEPVENADERDRDEGESRPEVQ